MALRADDLSWVGELLSQEALAKPVRLVEGGETRQQSVENALAETGSGQRLVAVHDAVRPFIDLATIEKVIREAAEAGAAIVGIVPVDTVKQVREQGSRHAPPRPPGAGADAAGIPLRLLKHAFEQAREDGFIGTDESSLVERLEQVEVSVVSGSDRNIKITKPSDMDWPGFPRRGSGRAKLVSEYRIGMGWDIHRLVAGRPLILGGIDIPSELGLEGHSDADVLAHAITDAILGAAALGDIGMHFPDTDPRWAGADSLKFLRHALRTRHGSAVSASLASTRPSSSRRPKLKDYREAIREAGRRLGLSSTASR